MRSPVSTNVLSHWLGIKPVSSEYQVNTLESLIRLLISIELRNTSISPFCIYKSLFSLIPRHFTIQCCKTLLETNTISFGKLSAFVIVWLLYNEK